MDVDFRDTYRRSVSLLIHLVASRQAGQMDDCLSRLIWSLANLKN